MDTTLMSSANNKTHEPDKILLSLSEKKVMNLFFYQILIHTIHAKL